MKRVFPLSLFVLICGLIYWPSANSQNNTNVPTLEILKQLYPSRKWTPTEQKKFKSWRVDFNGDGRKEWLIVENPNKKVKKLISKKPKGCPCPKIRLKGKAKRLKNILRWNKNAIHNIKLIKIRKKRYHVKLWFSLQNVKRKRKSFNKQMLRWCRRLGKRYYTWKKWHLRRFIVINNDDGQTTSISTYRCRKLARRMSYKRRRYRFRRWSKKMEPTKIKLCPCPKKKKKIVAYRPPKALNIIVAKEQEAPKSPTPPPTTPTTDLPNTTQGPKLVIIGRFRGDNVQLSPLTNNNKIIGLRIQRQQQTSPYAPRSTYEKIYIYDEGNSGRMKQVLQIETARENLDNESDARRWTTLTFRNMDSDSWNEIIADTHYENPQYNGLLSRKMYKWREGRYVPLNKYRGILRAIASSTWQRIAPKAGRTTQRRLGSKTMPTNVVDGFRNTIWVGAKAKRSIGDWVRVEFMRSKKLFGIAISVVQPQKPIHIIPNLFPKGLRYAPKLIAPKYVRITTSSSIDMTVALDTTKRYNLIMFPNVVWTRFVQISLVNRYRDSSKRTHKLKIPKKERSVGFVAEIMPLEAKVRYTASSFEYKGTESFLPRYAGDNRSKTAWA